MLRIAEDRSPGADLHDLAEIHHGDPVADPLHHRHVVRDEQVGEAQFRLEVEHQVHDLRLDRDVQRRDRLVGDDQPGVQGERPGDADALALAAGELVREAPGRLGRQADPGQQVLGPPPGLPGGRRGG